jgi:hypothetical protein
MMSLLELFVSVDDFCQEFLPFWERKLIEDGSKKRQRAGQLSVSKIMTIIIYFHQSQYRNFKAYYTEHVCQHLRGEFPKLVSYERFVILMSSVLGPLSAYLKSRLDQLKNISQIEHTRHRSPINCFINIMAGLIAYCHQPKKPSLHLSSTAFLSA